MGKYFEKIALNTATYISAAEKAEKQAKKFKRAEIAFLNLGKAKEALLMNLASKKRVNLATDAGLAITNNVLDDTFTPEVIAKVDEVLPGAEERLEYTKKFIEKLIKGNNG